MVSTLWLSQVDQNAFNRCAQLCKKVDVAVVGGGLMGVSAAYWLTQAGVSVLLMEAGAISCGASGRNAGLMLPGASPIEAPQLFEAVIKEEQIDAGYSIAGHLALASSAEIWEKILEEATTRPKHFSPVVPLDHGSCEDLLKLHINRRIFGGRWFAEGRVVHSAQFIYGLCAAAQRHGAVIAAGTRVLQVERSRCNGGFRIETDCGIVEADQVIYACSSNVVKFVPIFRDIITEVVAQMLSTVPVRPFFTVGFAIDWGTFYWRQTPEGNIVLGGGEVQKGHDNYLNPGTQCALEKLLPSVFPELPPIAIALRWAGTMDYTPDGKPLVGPVPNRPGEWVVAGFGGHGMPLGINVGKAVADAITTGKCTETLGSFNPFRFHSSGASQN